MIESLKDLYISYPFLPVEDKPDWFNHIKDVRLTVILDAANPILGYKNASNIRVWLTGLDPAHMVASFKVRCKQMTSEDIPVTANLVSWETGSPSTGNYVVIDSAALLPTLTEVEYELNPDVLLFMQNAPIMYYGAQQMPHAISVKTDHNVAASLTATGISLYGAAGGGTGVYTSVPKGMTLSEDKQSLGANSVNGTQGMVWLVATFPAKATTTIENGNLRITFSRESV